MSRNWKIVASPLLETNKVGILDGYLSSWQKSDKNFLDSKQTFKVYLKPRRKNSDFGFLPLPIMPVSLKIGHLIEILWNKYPCLLNFRLDSTIGEVFSAIRSNIHCVAYLYAVWPVYDVKCQRVGMREGGGATPTSISTFDSYDIKTLWIEFGHDIVIGFKMPTLWT